MTVETPEPTFIHDLHGGEGLFVGTLEQPGLTTEDVWVVKDAEGVHLVRRWSDRECDAETVTHPFYVEWAIERLEFRQWAIGELVKVLSEEEPC